MNARASAVHALEARIGYTFKDRELLERALTHASTGEGARKTANNEVLEFVGDRVLGLIIAEGLAAHYPAASEGELSPKLAALVSRSTCAQVAQEIGLGEALRMSGSATKVGARTSVSVLGGGCEALIAALYHDAGLEKTREIVSTLWRALFAEDTSLANRDPKGQLQNWALTAHRKLPVYSVVESTGPAHNPMFTVQVVVDNLPPQMATGPSRQKAEKAAAMALLIREGLAQ